MAVHMQHVEAYYSTMISAGSCGCHAQYLAERGRTALLLSADDFTMRLGSILHNLAYMMVDCFMVGDAAPY
jgi:hypothetical protein